ncbi:MAG: spore cortex biosynthesis protein YabQ [Clostridia bacterium]|nr:spore cortex biosynthesis protein YabQ [Clostridia bacterium]
MVQNQAYLFLIFVLNGILIGFTFDFFRILRISFKTKDFVTYLEDFLFWVITGIILIYSIFVFNNGEIRFFMFLGVMIGVLLYILLISKYIIKVNVSLISFIKKILKIPINLFIRIIKFLFIKPISFIIINIRKKIEKINKKYIKKEGIFVKK